MSDKKIFTAIILAAVVFIAGFCVVGYYSDKYECGFAQENSGTKTKFVKNHIFSWDCFVQVDGNWIPIDKWRGDES